MRRPVHRKPRKRHLLAWCVLTASLCWAAGFLVFMEALPKTPKGDLVPTDAVVVLTGGSLRVETGLQLLENGYAERLFVSGVHRGIDVAELIRVAERRPGRLECCITLGHNATDTIGNAIETAEWVAQHNIGTLRLVTAGYHMPRSLLELSARMPDVTILPHPVFPEHVKLDRWYLYPGTALLAAGEYSKFLAAYGRLQLEALWNGG